MESLTSQVLNHGDLVDRLKTKTNNDVTWDAETKKMIHEWIVKQLEENRDRVEVTNELGDICKEAGLTEESERQYKKAIDLATTI